MGDTSAIMGRCRELHRFRALARDTDVRLVSISGPAGIGKTALFGELMRECAQRGFPIVRVDLDAWETLSSTEPDVVAFWDSVSAAVPGRDSGPLRWTEVRRTIDAYRKARARVLERFDRDTSETAEQVLRAGVSDVASGLTAAAGILGGPVATIGAKVVTDEAESAIVSRLSKAIHRLKPHEQRLLEQPGRELRSAATCDIMSTFTHGRSARVVIALDQYELVPMCLASWLRSFAGRDLDRRVLFIVAGRRRLSADWSEEGTAIEFDLAPLSPNEVTAFLAEMLTSHGRERDAPQAAKCLGEYGRIPFLLGFLKRDPTRLLSALDASRQGPQRPDFDWGLALEQYVSRMLPDRVDRRAAMAMSVPRRLNYSVLELVLDVMKVARRDAYSEWLRRDDLMDPNAPAFTLHAAVRDVLRGCFAQGDPDKLRILHDALAQHYAGEADRAPSTAAARAAQVEEAYHLLSAAEGAAAAAVLQQLLVRLPHSYALLNRWSVAIEQVLDEQRPASEVAAALERLANLAKGTWDAATRRPTDAGGSPFLDPAADVFAADLLCDRGVVPRVTDDNYDLWLRQFETRLELLRGDARAAGRAKERLRFLYRQCELLDRDPSNLLLRFLVATSLAEASNRRGDVGEALCWSKKALDRASEGPSNFMTGVALVNVGSNLKRANHFSEALGHLRNAEELLVQSRPLPRYRLGLLMLETANCHLYLRKTALAVDAVNDAESYFADVSPQRQAETRARRGWARRLQGDLDGSLDDHRTAIEQFDRLEGRQEPLTAESGKTMAIRRAAAQHSMANTLTEMNRFSEAVAVSREAITVFEELGPGRHASIARKDMAPALYVLKGPKEADDELCRALAGLKADDERVPLYGSHIVDAYASRCRICILEGRLGSARDALNSAAETLERLGPDTDALQAQVKLELSIIAVLENRLTEALDLLREIEAYAEGADSPRFDLQAWSQVVRAIGSSRQAMGSEDTERAFREARRVAAKWNRYLPYDVDRLWARLAKRPPSPDPLLDTFDEDGTPLEPRPRSAVHSLGLWHRVFHCWIIELDMNGRLSLVLQRRGPYKRAFPNRLDISAAGHLHAGEVPVQGGLREIHEELALEVAADELRQLAERRIDERVYNGEMNREVQCVYLLERPPCDLSTYHPAYPELHGVIRCRLADARRLLDDDIRFIEAEWLEADLDGKAMYTTGVVTTADFITEARPYLRATLALIAAVEGAAAPDPSLLEEQRLDDGSEWRPVVAASHAR